MEWKIKFWLNNLFLEREQVKTKKGATDARYSTFVVSLNEAALNWMVFEVESYLTLLTARQCTQIKVWKTVETDRVFDVFFHIQAKGRSAPIDLKTYVKFPEKDKCIFELEDWAVGTRGYVNGRVIKNNGLFKCETIINQTNVPATSHDYLEDIRMEG